jgi:hypothetical protein
VSERDEITVSCRRRGEGWACDVTLGSDSGATRHAVSLSDELLARLRPGAAAPDELVRRSFDFLLAREPRASILREFELPVIGSYFPEWEAEMLATRGGD